jgi:hypothetical protein
MKFIFYHLKLKFHWNIAMLIHICNVCSCFHATMAGFCQGSQHDTQHMPTWCAEYFKLKEAEKTTEAGRSLSDVLPPSSTEDPTSVLPYTQKEEMPNQETRRI